MSPVRRRFDFKGESPVSDRRLALIKASERTGAIDPKLPAVTDRFQARKSRFSQSPGGRLV
jgi:hypothetical protein